MRIHFKKHAKPNPEWALPDPGGDGSSRVLILPHGVPFLPGEFVAQGYTHYEVWCIGGAGGRGGDGGGRTGIGITGSGPTEQVGFGWEYYFTPDSARPGYYITHYHSPSFGRPFTFGGGGGGGGMQLKSGLLVSLPDECPVVVGSAGIDAPLGQNAKPSGVNSDSEYPYGGTGTVKEGPSVTAYPPANGGDGGASTFNGMLCQASGGKGGGPSTYWDDNILKIHGDGGAGGVGGQTVAGGGALGSTSEANPLDGSWNGVNGKGGGGGHGGAYIPPGRGSGYGG